MSESRVLAVDIGPNADWPRTHYFLVSDLVVAEFRDWSGPAQFRFEGEGERLELVIRALDESRGVR